MVGKFTCASVPSGEATAQVLRSCNRATGRHRPFSARGASAPCHALARPRQQIWSQLSATFSYATTDATLDSPSPVPSIIASASIATAAILASACLACFPAQAESITGVPRTIDGDTLDFSGTRVRLYGIDAPETAQQCRRKAGAEYACGSEAKEALASKIGGKQVACEVKNTDMYGRSVAKCFLGKEDLNGWMVATGEAVAYKEYSKDYIAIADDAKAARKGIWDGSFEYPADWRRDNKRSSTLVSSNGLPAGPSSPPNDKCVVKGNISSSGDKIYHVPGGSFYERTVIDLSADERWFCTSGEAEKAGWRASKR